MPQGWHLVALCHTHHNSWCPHAAGTASSGSSLQLVGGVLPIPEGQDGGVEQETPRASVGSERYQKLAAFGTINIYNNNNNNNAGMHSQVLMLLAD